MHAYRHIILMSRLSDMMKNEKSKGKDQRRLSVPGECTNKQPKQYLPAQLLCVFSATIQKHTR